jgi:hypothetical protein
MRWDDPGVASASSCRYGLERASNHWRLRGNKGGELERGWAWAGRGCVWLATAEHACERSLLYCLRILRFSCVSRGERERGSQRTEEGEGARANGGGLTASAIGSPTRSLTSFCCGSWADGAVHLV